MPVLMEWTIFCCCLFVCLEIPIGCCTMTIGWLFQYTHPGWRLTSGQSFEIYTKNSSFFGFGLCTHQTNFSMHHKIHFFWSNTLLCSSKSKHIDHLRDLSSLWTMHFFRVIYWILLIFLNTDFVDFSRNLNT